MCNQYPSILYYDKADESFLKLLRKADVFEWTELYRCRKCGKLWRIDIWDKYQERFIVAIDDEQSWKDFDKSELVKKLMVKNRGGLQDEKCVMARCKNNRVCGSVYCIDHLYNSGARR